MIELHHVEGSDAAEFRSALYRIGREIEVAGSEIVSVSHAVAKGTSSAGFTRTIYSAVITAERPDRERPMREISRVTAESGQSLP